jgi:hypothetical protein
VPPDLAPTKGSAQQGFGKYFLEWYRAGHFGNQGYLTTVSAKPIDHLARVSDASAHEKKANAIWSHGQGNLIPGPSLSVSQQLIFVHHKKVGTKAFRNRISLGFQGCHDYASIRTVA